MLRPGPESDPDNGDGRRHGHSLTGKLSVPLWATRTKDLTPFYAAFGDEYEASVRFAFYSVSFSLIRRNMGSGIARFLSFMEESSGI